MSATSGRASSLSATNSRTVSSIRARASSPARSTWTRLWRASASVRSSARSSSRPAAWAAASMVQPSTNTAAVSSSDRSVLSSRPTLHSTVARSVRWRSGMSTHPVPTASSEVVSRARSVSGSSIRVRAAASSMASGTPSSRRQISTTAEALRSVRANPGRTARARSTNSASAGADARSSIGLVAASGRGSGGTRYSHSARSPSTVRLVARISTPGQRARSSPRSRAESTTCSRLSRMSSHGLSPRYSTRASSGESVPAKSAPTARAMAGTTRSGCTTDANETYAVPEPTRSRRYSPTATPSRDLPIPPGPVRVTRRTSGRPSRPVTSPMACSRPMSDVVSTGSGTGFRDDPGATDGPAGAAEGVAVGGGADVADVAGPAAGGTVTKRSLSNKARSSRARPPSSRLVRKRRYESAPSALMRSSIAVRRGSRAGAGSFTYSRWGSPRDTSNSSSRPEISMPGPIQP